MGAMSPEKDRVPDNGCFVKARRVDLSKGEYGSCPPGTKHDGDKLDWSLLPVKPIESVIEVLMAGARKYAPDNWKQVSDPLRRYRNAATRHIMAAQAGETHDPETGMPHASHAVTNLLFYLWHLDNSSST